jgi:hypothetical protein
MPIGTTPRTTGKAERIPFLIPFLAEAEFIGNLLLSFARSSVVQEMARDADTQDSLHGSLSFCNSIAIPALIY